MARGMLELKNVSSATSLATAFRTVRFFLLFLCTSATSLATAFRTPRFWVLDTRFESGTWPKTPSGPMQVWAIADKFPDGNKAVLRFGSVLYQFLIGF